MKGYYLLVAVALAGVTAAPASATIVSLAQNVDLSTGPYSVNLPEASYTFSYVPNGLSTVALAMDGTGQVYGNGFFSQNSPDPLQIGVTVPDQLSLGEFFNQQGTQSIPYSIAQTFVALSFTTAGQTYYGYAGVAGSYLTQFAYNDTPGGSILTGATAAVPEPASWAMMIGGVGFAGGAMRRRRGAVRATIRFA